MSDETPFYAPNRPPVPPRQPKSGEPLWAFVRESDKKRFECELRFNGESYGWEAQIFTTHREQIEREEVRPVATKQQIVVAQEIRRNTLHDRDTDRPLGEPEWRMFHVDKRTIR